jgi:hypothetical protein
VKKFLARLWVEAHKNQKGEVNIGAILMLGIAMVFIAVGFIMFPIATSATDTILAYSYSSNGTINAAYFTGLSPIVGITPLLILLGFISAAVITGLMGVRTFREGTGGKLSPSGLLMLGLSIVFIAVGLIMFPVALDGIASVIHNSGTGISTTYTGLGPILLITPMLILLAYLSASVIVGFFGVRTLGNK